MSYDTLQEIIESERNHMPDDIHIDDVLSSSSYDNCYYINSKDCQLNNNCLSSSDPRSLMAPRPAQYSESIALTHIPSYEEVNYDCECVYEQHRHYRDEVRLQQRRPGDEPPTRYSCTEICYNNSSYRRFRDEVYHIQGVPSNKQFSTTVFLFPKTTQETVTSSITHYPARTVKWFKTTVQMEARDHVSMKFIHVNDVNGN